jgi:hypothetical protein
MQISRIGRVTAGVWKRSGAFMEALAPGEAPFHAPARDGSRPECRVPRCRAPPLH